MKNYIGKGEDFWWSRGVVNINLQEKSPDVAKICAILQSMQEWGRWRKNRTASSPQHTAKHAKSYRSSECEIRNLMENLRSADGDRREKIGEADIKKNRDRSRSEIYYKIPTVKDCESKKIKGV